MGGPQTKTCMNCRHLLREKITDSKCVECWDFSQWQTKRGAKAGAPRKPGAGRTPFEDQGEKRQIVMLSFKANDITKFGGYESVKEWLTKKFYDIIKGS